MSATVPRILLTGPPRAGKTTLVSHLVEELTAAGVPVGGFLTREIREQGRRVGFRVQEIGGPQALLAHVTLPQGPEVGRYRVDVAGFESVALPAVERAARRGTVTVIDELGQMELLSPAFIDSFGRLLERAVPLVATVHARQHPVTDAWKRRPGVELVEVHRDGADALLARLRAELAGSAAGRPGSGP